MVADVSFVQLERKTFATKINNFIESINMETVVKKEPEVFSPDKIYSLEEYLAIEARSIEKHEFRDGKVIKMPGAKPAHNIISANVIAELKIAVRQKERKYIVMTNDTPIHIPFFNNIVYPDAVVVCEQIELYPGSSMVITNPLLIVEVLSPSTENHDRQGKFYDYKQIPSFKEHLLVAQKMPYVFSSFKTAERTWEDTEAKGLNASIYLKSLDCTIELRNIYEDVVFST